MKVVFCTFQLPRVRPRQEPATAASGTMMEGGMQLLNRDGHSISHNSKHHYHDSFVSMNRMRQRGLLCDIVLHVSNKEIKAHKVVLASCSPYFHAMFTSKFSPHTQCVCARGPACCFSFTPYAPTSNCASFCSVAASSLPFPSSRLGHLLPDEVCVCVCVRVQCASRHSVVWLQVTNCPILTESADCS